MREASVLDRVATVLPDLYALRRIDEFPSHALRLVLRTVGGNKADYTQLDLATGDFQVLVDPEPPQLRTLSEARQAHMHDHPVLQHFRRTSLPQARLISDFLTPRAFRRLGLYGEFFAHLDVEDQLTVLVSHHAARVRAGISIDRDRPGFDDRDRRLLDALRPHLQTARDNAARFSNVLANGVDSAHVSGPAIAGLTDRQREVLAQVARGLTDAQIALVLDISAHTVRKHLEHILRRLGASTRTAAAALYLTGGAADGPHWTASVAALVEPLP